MFFDLFCIQILLSECCLTFLRQWYYLLKFVRESDWLGKLTFFRTVLKWGKKIVGPVSGDIFWFYPLSLLCFSLLLVYILAIEMLLWQIDTRWSALLDWSPKIDGRVPETCSFSDSNIKYFRLIGWSCLFIFLSPSTGMSQRCLNQFIHHVIAVFYRSRWHFQFCLMIHYIVLMLFESLLK